MTNRNFITFLALGFILFVSCDRNGKSIAQEKSLQSIIEEVKSEFAPDGRVEIFDVSILKGPEKKWVLKGETTNPEGKQQLISRLNEKGISCIDSLILLPDHTTVDQPYGLVHISVANLRSDPSYRAELVTQATLGTSLRILKNSGWWMLVQTPDKYISWINQSGVTILSDREYLEYMGRRKVIYTGTTGSSLSYFKGDNHIVSDLVAGSTLDFVDIEDNYFRVRYPDGRVAFINTDQAELLDKWLEKVNPEQASLAESAMQLLGRPYLWGGTSTKALDCSGFTKTVYFMNGVLLPRDASQQINEGILVDSTRNFENLVVGDLLFFGRKASGSRKERIVHVAMWIGDGKFIHASGDVNIRSMNSNDPSYDEYNYNRYIRSKRLINQNEKKLTYLKNLTGY